MGHSIQYASPTFLFRDICHSKLGHIMHRLAAIGFEGLELYGMFGLSSEEILSFLEESGLTIICDHIHYEEFSSDTLNVITRRTALGCEIPDDRCYPAHHATGNGLVPESGP